MTISGTVSISASSRDYHAGIVGFIRVSLTDGYDFRAHVATYRSTRRSAWPRAIQVATDFLGEWPGGTPRASIASSREHSAGADCARARLLRAIRW